MDEIGHHQIFLDEAYWIIELEGTIHLIENKYIEEEHRTDASLARYLMPRLVHLRCSGTFHKLIMHRKSKTWYVNLQGSQCSVISLSIGQKSSSNATNAFHNISGYLTISL